MTAPDYSELRALAERATGGRWLVCECERVVRTGDMYAADGYSTEFSGFEILGLDDKVVHSPDDGIQEADDAAFIAAANPATILSLLDALSAATATNAGLVEALTKIKKMKAEPIGETGFQTGPAAHFMACQEIARTALAATQGSEG